MWRCADDCPICLVFGANPAAVFSSQGALRLAREDGHNVIEVPDPPCVVCDRATGEYDTNHDVAHMSHGELQRLAIALRVNIDDLRTRRAGEYERGWNDAIDAAIRSIGVDYVIELPNGMGAVDENLVKLDALKKPVPR